MGFLVSPGVDVNEIDLTNVIPAVSTSIGGIVGHFKWGPVEEVVSVGSEKELVANFGEPDDNTYKQWFQASAFLQYGNALNVYRYNSASLNNASSNGGTYLVKNLDNYTSQTLSVSDSPIGDKDYFVARYAGALGNSLKVCVITSDNYNDEQVGLNSPDDSSPKVGGNSNTHAIGAVRAAPSIGEIHIVILDEDGDITGTANTVLEVFSDLTVVAGKRDDGTSSYYVDVLETQSAYVWPTNNVISATNGDSPADDYNFALSGGNDGTAPATDALQAVYTTAFGDADTLDVNILIGPTDADSSAVGYAAANAVIAVASGRKDCVAVVSPPTTGTSGTALQSTAGAAVTNAKSWADSITTNSYGILSSTSAYVYDKYNDVYRWIGTAGHVAGLLANVDDVAEPWFSPAGYNRGQLRGVVKLGYNPTSTQRDTLYKARINPLVSFPGQGLLLFGDKTAQSKPSAFDRINVRRLFIVLEKAISTASKFQLFELNDEFTRAMFRNMTEPFLRDVKGRRGITDFLVVCDETNNTGEVIDSNRFVADIYIKPARSINFITLNFIATRTGVEFSEIAGQQ
jgi:phage tail sheath protein FI